MVIPGFNFNPSSFKTEVKVVDSGQSKSENMFLRNEIERLLMITEALWTCLKEQHNYKDADLVKKIAEIDMRDGRLDGKVAPEVSELPTCPDCGRPVGKKRPTCLYCGTPLVRMPFAR